MGGDYDEEFYEIRLLAMLNAANIRLSTFYTPAEARKLLRVSNPYLRIMCENWEPLNVRGRRPDTIESYTFGGGRRIPHHALVEFLASTSTYDTEMKND